MTTKYNHILLIVLNMRVLCARYILPHVPDVLHPPVPDDGKCNNNNINILRRLIPHVYGHKVVKFKII